MESAERHELILRELRANGRIEVDGIAELSGCSTMTIRRDLDLLARDGLLRRIRGGAVSLLTGEEAPYPVRARTAADAKERIGKATADLLGDGQTVLIDGGTTALEVARALRDDPRKPRLTVLPLSLHVAQVLADVPGVRLIMPGGDVRPVELAFVGALTLETLRVLRFDAAVVGCCGIDVSDGLTGHDLDEAAVKRAALAAALRRIVVADAGKWGVQTFAVFDDLTAVDVVVTDSEAPADQVEKLRNRHQERKLEVLRV